MGLLLTCLGGHLLETLSPLSLGPPAPGLAQACPAQTLVGPHFTFPRLLLCLQLLSYAKKIPLLRVNCSISTIFQVEGSHQADSSRKTNLVAGSQAPGHRWGHLLVLPDPAAICKSAQLPWECRTGTRVRTAPSFSGACGFCCQPCPDCWVTITHVSGTEKPKPSTSSHSGPRLLFWAGVLKCHCKLSPYVREGSSLSH